MASIDEVAAAFFEACETGGGWDGCAQYCTDDATFSAQSETIGDITDLRTYADWMKGTLALMPDATYDLKAFAADPERNCVLAYAVFRGTHTGEGGPVPPTGNSVSSDYVYAMQFDGNKISHLTKVWHSADAATQLGWT